MIISTSLAALASEKVQLAFGDEVKIRTRRGKTLSHVWVVCPKRGKGRFVRKQQTRRANFTGLCRSCFYKSQGEKVPIITPDLKPFEGMIARYPSSVRGHFVWILCPDCGKGRWVRVSQAKKFSGYCKSCSPRHRALRGELNPNWTGWGHKNSRGYIEVTLMPDHPYYSMARKGGRVLEHRLVMAKYLGRPLEPGEIVHHKNGIKDDNRIENLELVSDQSKHARLMYKELVALRKRVALLEAEVTMLRKQTQEAIRGIKI